MICRYKPISSSILTEIELPVSKSMMNRYLILRALSGADLPSLNEAFPNDVKLMIATLSSYDLEINVEDAGTVMRFAAAYYASIDGERILKGKGRMHHRPIDILVEALNELGGDVSYLSESGFPPLKIKGKKLKGGKLSLSGEISSQFISAVLMIAANCERKVEVELKGKLVSQPYIEMTLEVMRSMGISFEVHENIIEIEPQAIQKKEIEIESDWSSASFVYEFLALSDQGEILLKNLKKDSFQGDSKCVQLFNHLGVRSIEDEKGIRVSKVNSELPDELEIDFLDIPDLFQPFVMSCFGLGIKLKATSLQNLHLKESNRLMAVKHNVEALGGKVTINGDVFELFPSSHLKLVGKLDVFDDHRMAMSLAPLSLKLNDLDIETPYVVGKSFPNFWKEMSKLGLFLD